MQVLKPIGRSAYALEAIKVALKLKDLRGKTIGCIDDGVGPLTGVLIKKFAELLQKEYGTNTIYRNKPNPSKISPPEMLDEIVKNCDAVVIGMCA